MRRLLATLAALCLVALAVPAGATEYPIYRFNACNTYDDVNHDDDDFVCTFVDVQRQDDGTGIQARKFGVYGHGPNSANVCDDLWNGGWEFNPSIVNHGALIVNNNTNQVRWQDVTHVHDPSGTDCSFTYGNTFLGPNGVQTGVALQAVYSYTARLNWRGDPDDVLKINVTWGGGYTFGCFNGDGSTVERCWAGGQVG